MVSKENKEKAQYYMTAANTLLLTSSILILAFVTSLTLLEKNSEIVFFLHGLLLLGFATFFQGLVFYFRSIILFENKKQKKDNHLNNIIFFVSQLKNWGFVILFFIIWIIIFSYLNSCNLENLIKCVNTNDNIWISLGSAIFSMICICLANEIAKSILNK